MASPLINRLSGLLRKIDLFMGCSVGFKYATNAFADGALPRTPLGELTMLPHISYSGADGMDKKKIKTQLPRYAYRCAGSRCH